MELYNKSWCIASNVSGLCLKSIKHYIDQYASLGLPGAAEMARVVRKGYPQSGRIESSWRKDYGNAETA